MSSFVDVKNLRNWILLNWFGISGFFILLGSLLISGMLLYLYLRLYRKTKEYDRRFDELESGNGVVVAFQNPALKYLSLHIQSVTKAPLTAVRIMVIGFVIFSIGIGFIVGFRLVDVYGSWKENLPYSQAAAGFAFIVGLLSAFLPFLMLHALIQQRRARLSNQLLAFVEEFEKKYIVNRDIYSVFNELSNDQLEVKYRDSVYRFIQALQFKNYEKFEHELILFEHQIGTKFANIFCILIREGLGLIHLGENENRRETKDIRVGIRSLIQKMHGILRVNQKDKPNKYEIVQIGFMTFPCLYGSFYLTRGIMGEKASKFLFENPTQMNIFVGAVIMGFVALAVNIVISRRKFDL